MAPRAYQLGKRAEAKAQTRAQIVAAAMALYQEQGFSTTSMQEVARRADVAPATVLNHFATPDDLVRAVVAQIMHDLNAPSDALFAELPSLQERVARLGRELAAFYERSEPWYRLSLREGGRSRVLAQAEMEFYERLDRLMQQALGPLATDERALAAVRTFMNPAVFGGLRGQGMSTEAAADLVVEVLTPWLEQRANARPRRSGGSD